MIWGGAPSQYVIAATAAIPSGAAASPFIPVDAPNPSGHRDRIANRTHLQGMPRELIGKDQFFAAPGQAPVYDWPNPRGPGFPINNRTHLQPLNLLLVPTTAPLIPIDWPNPRGPAYPNANRGFLLSMPRELVGQDKFFGGAGQPPANLDWPNPRGPRHPIDHRFWGDWAKLPLIVIPTIPPLAFDWPNPRGYPFPLANLGFITHRQIYLPSPTPLPVKPGLVSTGLQIAPAPRGLSPDATAWALRVVDVLNSARSGKLNATGIVTLTANAGSTTITDARISAFSFLQFMPLTADAATELASGSLYVSAQQSGQATVTHSNSASTDRQFRLVIIG